MSEENQGFAGRAASAGRGLFRNTGMLLACAVVLGLGVAAFAALPMLRKEPAMAPVTEQRLFVETLAVAPEDVQVTLTGYGAVRSLTMVPIAPEVSGIVAEVHPRLEPGEVIPAGEVLFALDPRMFQARVDDARATADQFRTAIRRLEVQLESDRSRLTTAERTRDLTLGEYERVRDLFEQDEVGTRSGVEQAERVHNQNKDAVDQLMKQLELYPLQIAEAKSSLEAAEARLVQAEVNLERSRVVAPFNARIKSKNIEAGQYVGPGSPVVTLADDSLLEISVPLNSQMAGRWLQFDQNDRPEGKAWFEGLRQVPCRVSWSEDPDRAWEGRLERVERVDEQTRTVFVAVRVTADQAGADGGMPLVEGMFCRVDIPGSVLEDVYRLPRSAVTFENTVYVSENGRLRTLPVTLAHEEGNEAFVSEGLAPGQEVITTRLVNPLENSLVETGAPEAAAPEARS
jgi:membrane fusion protein, multidrug efflux system